MDGSELTLAYKIQTVDPTAARSRRWPSRRADARRRSPLRRASRRGCVPRRLADAQGSPLPPGDYRLHWFVRPATARRRRRAAYDEPLRVVTADPGASFVLSDIPREVEAGKDATAQLAVQNLGAADLAKKANTRRLPLVLSGRPEAQWDGGHALAAHQGRAGRAVPTAISSAKFRAPDQPGRYALVFDVQHADGTWASTRRLQGRRPAASLGHGHGQGAVTPVDLSKDGRRVRRRLRRPGPRASPPETLPPDGTGEVDANPLLRASPVRRCTRRLFYAAQTGEDAAVQPRAPVPVPDPNGPTNSSPVRARRSICRSGNYKAVHLLWRRRRAGGDGGLRHAASDGQAPVSP